MKKIGLVINLVVLVVLMAAAGLLAWQLKGNGELNGRLEKKKNELSEAQSASRRLEELEKKVWELKRQEESIYKKVSLNEKQPLALVRKLINIGIEIGLKDFTFDIKEKSSAGQKEAVFSGAGMAGHSGVLSAGANPEISSQPETQNPPFNSTELAIQPLNFAMEFVGNFTQLCTFLEKMSGIERIIAVDGIRINRDEQLLPYQKFSLELLTYTFPEENR